MSDVNPIPSWLVLGWIAITGIIGYACLAYAVMQSHGDAIAQLVNRILPGGV